MRLSTWGYHADFVAYPLLIAALMARSLRPATPRDQACGLFAALAGLLAWTAVEYVLHRWVLHRMPGLRVLHAMHHRHPGALIGTPTWVSAPLFMALWAVLGWIMPASVAAGAAAGLMAGYLVYVTVHDAVHHRAARVGSWLHRSKVRHALHHQPGAQRNFGVSTGFWDCVAGSAEAAPPVRGRKHRGAAPCRDLTGGSGS